LTLFDRLEGLDASASHDAAKDFSSLNVARIFAALYDGQQIIFLKRKFESS
jgi:hypothetical protein